MADDDAARLAAVLAELKRRDAIDRPPPGLLDFLAQTSPHLVAPTWLAPLAAALERMVHEPTRLVINTPPQHGKSTLAFHFIAWVLRYFERRRLLYITYSIDFAVVQMREARPIAQLAEVPFVGGPQSLCEWRTTRESTLAATGIGGAITGRPGGIILIDDPIKDWTAAQSKATRESTDAWLRTSVLTRMHPTSSCALIQTRWHEDDVSARWVKQGWQYVNLPAISDDGLALWPEGRPLDFLEYQRSQIGPHMFEALYQGRPRPREGHVFDGCSVYSQLPTSGRYAIGVDLAYTAKTQADWSVAVVLCRGADERYYVVDVVRKQCAAPDFVDTLKSLQSSYPSAPIRWYAAGTEKGSADFIQRAGVRLQVSPPKGDKFVRATPVSAAWKAEKVLVPGGQDVQVPGWVPAFLDEVLEFTGAGDAHDDQVDALAAAFDALSQNVGPQAHVPTSSIQRERPYGPRTGSRARPY